MNWRGVAAFAFFFAVGLGGYRLYSHVSAVYDSLPGTGNLPLEDLDAGPIHIARSPCFLAKVNKTAKQCVEPAVIAGRAHTYLTRARYFMEMAEHEKALADVDAALAIDGDDAALHHLAGRLAITLSDIERADKELVIARRLKPNDAQIEASYAIVLMGRGANSEAQRILSDVIARNPRHLFPRLQRAAVSVYLAKCCWTGHWLAALEDYNVLIYRAGPKMQLLEGRARALLALHRPEEAAADLDAALKLSPNNSGLIRDRAKAYAMSEKYDDAIATLDALLEVQGGSPVYPMFENERAKVLMDRANIFVEMHRFEDAVKDAVAAVSQGGKRAVLRAQVMLRRHGFPDVPLNGEVSDRMRQALSACFGLKSCFYELRAI